MILTILSLIDHSFGIILIKCLIALFLAILFIRPALDKLINFKTSLNWLQDHFKNSPLSSFVPVLLISISILELISGSLSLLSLWGLLHDSNTLFSFALLFSGVTILGLFFGQQMAKDYNGAAIFAPYFIIVLIGAILVFTF